MVSVLTKDGLRFLESTFSYTCMFKPRVCIQAGTAIRSSEGSHLRSPHICGLVHKRIWPCTRSISFCYLPQYVLLLIIALIDMHSF